MSSVDFYRFIGSNGADDYIRRLHAKGPIHRDDSGLWVVCGFDLVREVLRDHVHFSSSVMEDGHPLLTDDPPRHTDLRKLVRHAFTPAAVSALKPAVEATALHMVSRIEARVEVDIIAALAAPLAVHTIMAVLGVPEDSRERFLELAGVITNGFGVTAEDPRKQALVELQECLRGCLAARRNCLGGDVIGAVATCESNGTHLSEQNLLGLATLLLIAGSETTASLIGSVIYRAVHEHPGWRRLGQKPQLVVGLIEEVLRQDSPVRFVPRTAIADITLGGRRIRRGEKVVAYLAAANSDPERWSYSRSLGTGSPQQHLAFGHGIHFCLGAPLARLEAEAALQVLLRRFSGAEVQRAKAERRPSQILNGFGKLPLVFS